MQQLVEAVNLYKCRLILKMSLMYFMNITISNILKAKLNWELEWLIWVNPEMILEVWQQFLLEWFVYSTV